jgi:hypothetical protein
MVGRLLEADEQVFVETLVAQSANKAFDKAILHRFARWM